MAYVRNLSETLRGRLGNMIFYSRGGKTFARSRPLKVNDADTPLQQQQRRRMRDVTAFYKVVRQSPLYPVWRLAAAKLAMSGMNFFVKQNIAAFSGEGRVTDYEKLHFSWGRLPQADCFRSVYRAEGRRVEVQWENATLLSGHRYSDRLMVVALFEGDEFTVLTEANGEGGRRSDGRACFPLPEGYPPLRKVYCFFAAADGNAYSADVCCDPYC